MKGRGYKNSTMPVHTRVCDEQIEELKQEAMEERASYEAEIERLRDALEDLYSMANSPQWRNEPLYRICELIEKALDGKE